jgi:hypothetical protein
MPLELVCFNVTSLAMLPMFDLLIMLAARACAPHMVFPVYPGFLYPGFLYIPAYILK